MQQCFYGVGFPFCSFVSKFKKLKTGNSHLKSDAIYVIVVRPRFRNVD